MTAVLIPNLVAFVLLLIGVCAARAARSNDRQMGTAIGLLATPRLCRPLGAGDDDSLRRVIGLTSRRAGVARQIAVFFIAAGGLVIGRFL